MSEIVLLFTTAMVHLQVHVLLLLGVKTSQIEVWAMQKFLDNAGY